MAQRRAGGQRLAVVLAVALAVAVVIAAVALRPRESGGSGPTADGADQDDVASCLGPVLRDDGDGPCADLRARLSAQDPATVDVVVLVPGTEDGDRAAEAIGAAAGMWQDGLSSLSASGSAAEAPVIEVSTTRLEPGTAVHPLLDPEVVVIAATAAAGEDGPTLAVYDAGGTRCATFDDALALPTWTVLPGFASHHRLPEGIHRQPCGAGDDQVCVAVNATFDPAARADVDPFEQFGLVGDELGHCLRLGTTAQPR